VRAEPSARLPPFPPSPVAATDQLRSRPTLDLQQPANSGLQQRRPRENIALPDQFPTNLPFVRTLDISFTTPVTFFVGENGSGKSTVLEAIAAVCGLPAAGGGRNELADLKAPQFLSELAPFVRGAFRRKPRDGYFFRAEFQAHFASLLDQRRDDPDFGGNPYARYGGRSLHTRSHGEAFLEVFSAWLNPGMIARTRLEGWKRHHISTSRRGSSILPSGTGSISWRQMTTRLANSGLQQTQLKPGTLDTRAWPVRRMASISDEHHPLTAAELHYAGLWPRLLAHLVDLVVCAPLVVLGWPGLLSKNAALGAAIPLLFAGAAYSVALHARFGQTIGKMVAGVKIVTVGGGPIGWREALLRDSVGIGLGLISTATTIAAFLRIPEASWSHHWMRQAELIRDAKPAWGRAAGTAASVWFWSELVVLLLNRKKRALHDFIAGTVVIRTRGPQPVSSTSSRAA